MKRKPLRGLYAPELLESRIAPATFLVTTLDDAGAGSLRAAIDGIAGVGGANDAPGADTITFAPALFVGVLPKTILLTTGEIPIAGTITIKGPGIDRLTISGGGASRIFNIADGDAAVLHPTTISGLTLLAGNAAGEGGAIRSTESLTLSKVVVASSTATGATGDGGGVAVNTTGKVRIDNTHFIDNAAGSDGGGLYARAGGGITVTKCLVSGNTSGSFAGGLYLGGTANGAKILVDGCTFIGNGAATRGGGLAIDPALEGIATIKNSTFTGNTAGSGGALYLNDVTATIDRCVFSRNTASGNGGAISDGFIDALVIKNSRFDGNTADRGGALDAAGAHPITITGSLFTANESTVTTGGAIHAQGGIVLMVKTSTFSGNAATTDGGAISLTGTGTALVLSGSTVSGNSAVNGGGIHATEGAALTVSGGSFVGNAASIAGGAILTDGAGADAVNVSITGTLLQGNSATRGGAMDSNGAGTILVKNARVLGNVATTDDGGGMYLRSSSSIIVQSSLFMHNLADDDGGGLIMDANGAAVSRILSSKFLDNYAGDQGGGFAIFDGTVEIKSSLISGNVAAVRGGGVTQDGGTATFTGSTKVLGNWALAFPNIYP